MADHSAIEWTDATWNPVRGCSLVSAGCTNCYAMRDAHRFSGPGTPYDGLTKLTEHGPVWTGEIRLVPELLDQPLRWEKPRRIFVNSMSDLFHPEVPSEFIAAVFHRMAMAKQHIFQVLTKRPERMFQWCTGKYSFGLGRTGEPVTLTNVWLGVSVEDQATADERIPILLQTPAAVRWVSAEPLLEPIDLFQVLPFFPLAMPKSKQPPSLDWVVVGGESGPGARPMHPAWVRSIRDQCLAARVPFFFKQWGEFRERTDTDPVRLMDPFVRSGGRGVCMARVGKKAAGRRLDGRTWDEMPRIPA